MPRITDLRFSGHIAGFGTASGVRLVIGIWNTSPFGRFADIMIEDAAGKRTLVAPTEEVADFVSTAYSFEEVVVAPVTLTKTSDGLRVVSTDLDLRLRVGSSSLLGRVLRIVPAPIATHPTWLSILDPVARTIMPGTRTAGSAGEGMREFYGVTAARRITDAAATWHGVDLGELAPLSPPVRFGFGSAPAAPHLVDVVTTIR